MWLNLIKRIFSPLSNLVAKLVCPIWLTNCVPDPNGLNEILPFYNNFPFLQFCFSVNSTTRQIWEWKHSQTIANGWNWHLTTEIKKKKCNVHFLETENKHLKRSIRYLPANGDVWSKVRSNRECDCYPNAKLLNVSRIRR